MVKGGLIARALFPKGPFAETVPAETASQMSRGNCIVEAPLKGRASHTPVSIWGGLTRIGENDIKKGRFGRNRLFCKLGI